MSSSDGLVSTWRRWSAVGERLENPVRARRQVLLGVALLTVLHWALSPYLPLSEDEIYYWTWAKHLSLSYYDHPPVLAWAIAAGTAIFGDNAFGIRFVPSLLASGSVALLSGILPGASAALWLLLTPAFLFGALFATPDLPLIFCWCGYLRWLTMVTDRLELWHRDPMARAFSRSPVTLGQWIGGGLWLGVGILSKYTMILALPCAFLVLVLWAQRRVWWFGFLVHCLIAAALGSLVVIFASRYGYEPLRFQWNHAVTGSGGRFGDFLLGQLALFGALAPIGIPVAVWYGGRFAADPRLRPSLVFFLLPTLFFFGKAIRAPLEANWPLVGYFGLIPLFDRWPRLSSFPRAARTLRVAAFLPAVVTSALLLAHVVHPLPFLAASKDRYRHLRAKFHAMETLAAEAKKTPSAPAFGATYQTTSYLRFFGVPAEQLPQWQRGSQFTLRPVDPCQFKAIHLVLPASDEWPSRVDCFPNRTAVAEGPEFIGTTQVGHWRLWLAERDTPPEETTEAVPKTGTHKSGEKTK